MGRRVQVEAVKRAGLIAIAAFLAGAAAVAVPHWMGIEQVVLVALSVSGAILATALAVRLAMEERSRRQIEKARRQMVAAVSHDLRTPLASLRLLVEAIDDGVATGETRDRYLAEMRTHVEALTKLIDDTVAAMRAPAEASGVSLSAELPAHEVLARANAERVQRVLFNLIQNAIRHTPTDGSVTVRARSGGDGVEVEVVDEGAGVPAGDGERVFEAFYRGDEARSEEGAGLGLAISRAIVEAHGGRIWLEDGAPGTRVRFTLRPA
jgi:signal transduction histidine kinase